MPIVHQIPTVRNWASNKEAKLARCSAAISSRSAPLTGAERSQITSQLPIFSLSPSLWLHFRYIANQVPWTFHWLRVPTVFFRITVRAPTLLHLARCSLILSAPCPFHQCCPLNFPIFIQSINYIFLKKLKTSASVDGTWTFFHLFDPLCSFHVLVKLQLNFLRSWTQILIKFTHGYNSDLHFLPRPQSAN